ncbi:hypothetical protein [uncultured Alistipes sp.]|jgi:hypothetical protein|uniref:hypothetical protein n=1 Tax=uncultured Alistipes sp. TaxID=538949 RepID=UPI0025E5455D|nr:hypothetical protein [uncultured Alistipes sp.]
MKNIKLLLIGLAAAFALIGCSKSSGKDPGPGPSGGSVVGEWHMISWSAQTTPGDVYISFKQGGTFDIYQRLYTSAYVHLEGTYTYDVPTLSGQYSDGAPWGGTYMALLSSNGTRLTLTRTGGTDDISVFEKTQIPSEIISGELEGRAVQSDITEDMPRFL